MVGEAGVLQFEVLADEVVAGLGRELDVAAQGGVVGSRDAGFGPVALVEHAAYEQPPPVEVQGLAVDGDGAQTGVRGDPVGAVGGGQLRVHVVEVRVLRRPQPGCGERKFGGEPSVGVQGRRDGGVLVAHPQPEFGAVGRGAVHDGFDGDAGQVVVRAQPERGEVGGGAGLQPDALPDAGGGGEADAVVVVAGHAALLAVGDVPLVGGGVDPHRELVFAVAEGVGDVGGEGGVAALVVGDLGAVHPDRGGVVHGAEVQHDALSGPVGGHGERAPVPGGPEPVLGDAGGGRLPGEGHGDGAVVAVGRVGGVRLGGVGAEVPGAVEGEPGVGPVEVRAGVFGTGVVMGVCAPIRCGCGAVGGVRGKLSP